MRGLRSSGLLAVFFVLVVVALVATSVSSRQSNEIGSVSTTDELNPLEAPISMSGPTALLREDDPLPGAPIGETVSSISNPVVNHVGGYGLTVNSTGSGTTLSNVWGNATGGPGTLIITEATYGNLMQTSFESFHGLSDAGVPAYSASSNDTDTGTTGLDGAWLGSSVVLNEEEPVPTLPGQFSTFNSRPGITALGQPYWVGGISATAGSSTQNRVLFFGVGATPVLMGGDSIVGVPELVKTGSSNIDFDYRYSQFGTNYLSPVLVDASTTIDGVLVSNGAAVMLGGALVREGSPIPAIVGGLLDENWDNFDFMGITEDGLMFFTGEMVLKEGDEVDFDGDGLPDIGAVLANFTGISTLVVGDRQEDGIALVCFTADIDTEGTSSTSDDTEIFYCMEFQFEVVIPPDDEDEDGDEDDDVWIGIGEEVVVEKQAFGSGGSVQFGETTASTASVATKSTTPVASPGEPRSMGRGMERAGAVEFERDDLLERIERARRQVLREGLEGGGSDLRRQVESLLDEAETTGRDSTIEAAENVLRLLYDRVER